MNKRLIVSAALAAMPVAGLLSAVPASAATTTASATHASAKAGSCDWIVTAKTKLNLRPKKSPQGSNGKMPKGTSRCSRAWEKGGKVRACGKTGTAWDYVKVNGRKGWVPSSCLAYKRP